MVKYVLYSLLLHSVVVIPPILHRIDVKKNSCAISVHISPRLPKKTISKNVTPSSSQKTALPSQRKEEKAPSALAEKKLRSKQTPSSKKILSQRSAPKQAPLKKRPPGKNKLFPKGTTKIKNGSINKTQARAPKNIPAIKTEGQTSTHPLSPTFYDGTGNPAPSYPPQALRRKSQGTVIIRAFVPRNSDHPVWIHIFKTSGSALLDEEALETLKKWQFPKSNFDQLFETPIQFKI